MNNELPKETKPWKDTCKRFIAFMDIMGFKDMLFRKRHREVKNTLLKFVPNIEVMNKIANLRLAENAIGRMGAAQSSRMPITRPVLFSDSILLVSGDDSYDSAEELFLYVIWLVNEAISNSIAIKGAIAHGEQTA